MAAQAGNDAVDVVDSEHDPAYAQRVRRRAFRLSLTAGGVWNFDSSTRPWPSGVCIMAMSARTSPSPDGAVHPRPLDLRLAFQLHTEFGEERFGSLEVVDDDENVVHPLKRHIPGR